MMIKKILWIEDKAEKDIHQNIERWCKKQSIELIKVDDLGDFAEELESIKSSDNEMITGFIIDLLLSGTSNLSDFGIKYEWNHIQEDGGLILIQKVLRSNDFNYQDIPILVLSVRANKIPELEQYQKLEVIQKRDYLNNNWEGDIEKWLKGIKN